MEQTLFHLNIFSCISLFVPARVTQKIWSTVEHRGRGLIVGRGTAVRETLEIFRVFGVFAFLLSSDRTFTWKGIPAPNPPSSSP